MNTAGKVFVGQRMDQPEPAWQMPQGGIDRGENTETATWRELEEEVGLTTRQVRLIYTTPDWFQYDFPEEIMKNCWNGHYAGQKQKWTLFLFEGVDEDIILPAEEFSAWKWVRPEQLPELIVPFKRALYEEVCTRFQPYFDAHKKSSLVKES